MLNQNKENHDEMKVRRKETVTKMIEDIASEVCDHLCKYRETADDDCICDYMREHEQCPLDRLY